MNGRMESDELDFIRSDWNTYNDPPEVDKCIYCGEEENLNVVHYAIKVDLVKKEGKLDINNVDTITLSVNPKMGERVKTPKGYKREIELVCQKCFKEAYPEYEI